MGLKIIDIVKKYWKWLIVSLIWLIIVQAIFNIIQKNQMVSITKSIHGQLRQELDFSNFHYLSRNLADLASMNLIGCVELIKMKPNTNEVILDLSYMGKCSPSSITMTGIRTSIELIALNGDKYILNFTSINSTAFIISVWLMRLIGILQILLVNYYLKTKREKSELKYKLEKIHAEQILKMSSQIAHDIRSPLAALNLLTNSINHLEEDRRLLVRNSVQRINDIANNLLTQSRQHEYSNINNDKSVINNTKSCLLGPVVDSIVSEKRIQYRDRGDIKLNLDLSNSYGVFANININEVKRTLSNLINNSYEAIKSKNGNINIQVYEKDNFATIQIEDNGCGIPEHILQKLGARGLSHGKEYTDSGSGLGIYHAKETIEQHGGQLKIFSQLGVGTKISILFKKSNSPSWFIEKIGLAEYYTICILDDDPAIHNLWKERLNSLNISLTTKNYFSGSDLINDQCKANIYLIDYELINQNLNGLDIIKKTKFTGEIILVTSRYEDSEIQKECETLNIKLIPKNLAALIPIYIQEKIEKFDCVLLDDDDLMQLTWKFEASRVNKKFIGFFSFSELEKNIKTISYDSNFYIDINLGHGERGDILAEKLFNLGFKNLNLTTGYDADSIKPQKYIKKILSKTPQFE